MKYLFWCGWAAASLAFSGAAGCSTLVAAGDAVQGAAGGGARSGPLATRGALLTAVRGALQPLPGRDGDYDALMTMVGDSRFVLLGESTHGTQEFYRERARITQRLIREKGFTGAVIEGDWPDAERVNRYVRGTGTDRSPEQALSGFTRFPRWMWGNTEVRDLVQSLRARNEALPAGAPRVGFYGMDVYSLHASADAVTRYLERVDPEAGRRARERYRVFAAYRERPEEYGLAALSKPEASGERAAREQFQELEQRARGQARPDDELFSALQNARVVKNAEEYYRTMYGGRVSSWNLRDRHMADTLDALSAHLGTPERPAKLVVWAHNSHVGDARVTAMGESGEWNVGQLMRERHKEGTFLLGFTTYTGTVMAASEWGEAGKVQRVQPSLPGSYGALFHETGIDRFLLRLRGGGDLSTALGEPRLERAIGVVYLPQTERESHYFEARLSKQFDAVIHIDETRAVTPLRP